MEDVIKPIDRIFRHRVKVLYADMWPTNPLGAIVNMVFMANAYIDKVHIKGNAYRVESLQMVKCIMDEYCDFSKLLEE